MKSTAFMVVTGFVLFATGCAGMDNLIAQGLGKAAEPEIESQEAEQWRWALEKKEAAEKRPRVVDAATYERAWRAVDGYVDQLAVYRDGNCTSSRAGHCADAEALSAEAAGWQKAMYAEAVAQPGIDFDLLQDRIMAFERRDTNRGVSIDAWMEELGKRKIDYWSSELGKRGGALAKYAEDNGEPICLAYAQDPKASDTKNIDFMFAAADRVWFKCSFTRPPAEFTRNDGDYWRIEIFWGGEWEDIQMTYDVASPSTSPTIVFSFPANVIGEKIKKKADATGFLYLGSWLRVRATYTTRFISGQAWQDAQDGQDGRWVDTWKHEPMAAASVYLKWK